MKERWVDMHPDCPDCQEIAAYRNNHPEIKVARPNQILLGTTKGTYNSRRHGMHRAKAVVEEVPHR